MNIDVIAVEFGYWATPRYDGEFPRVAAGFAEMKCDAKYAEPRLKSNFTDEQGMIIDGYLQLLKRHSRELYDVFEMEYIKRWENKSERWRFFRMGKSSYYEKVKIAKLALLLSIVSDERNKRVFAFE